MREILVVFARGGEQLTMHRAESGRWRCPVCGDPCLDAAPYVEGGSASFQMCACGFEFGFDDDWLASDEAGATVAESHAIWRQKLVEEARGDLGRISRLRANLREIGVEIE